VIFIAPSFTEYQKHSINFRDVPFELWEINKYANQLLAFTQHKSTSAESISVTAKSENGVVESVSKEVKVYTEDFHLNQPKVQEHTKQLYQNLRERILNLGSDIELVPRKIYIGYKRKTNFIDITIAKNELWCWLNLKKGELDDPKNLSRDVSTIGHYGNGDYDLSIYKDTDLDYVMFLVKQAYNRQS
jgi:predicted transport protein